jgi:sugar transferase (PEP-CTERM/EpsH1 system associated)
VNVLMLTTSFPYPPTHGGALRVWNVLLQVAQRHPVTLLTMVPRDGEPSPEAVAKVREHVKRVELVPLPQTRTARLRNSVASLCGGAPYTIANFRFEAFARKIRELLTEEDFGLIHCHYLHIAQYHEAFGDAARYFDCHNINRYLWERYADAPSTGTLARLFAQHQARLLQRYEPEIWRHFDVATFCSEEERDYALERQPDAAFQVSPNGVDCSFFQPFESEPEPHTIVFSASMNATQNIDAALYLAEDIFPLIQARYPDSMLYLVGQKPAPEVRRLATDRIVVTGTVDDVRPYVERAAVYVAPIRIGGGTRLKILEAMAMAKAVVSTRVGAEGIRCADGENIVLADSAEGFASSVLSFFEHPEERRKLGHAGRELVESTYEWNAIGEKIAHYYDVACANAAKRRGRSA